MAKTFNLLTYGAGGGATRSALINRRFQIWQDGETNANIQTGYTSADMWLMVRNSPNGTVTAHRTPSGMFVTNNSDDTIIIIQFLFGGDIQTQQQWIGRSIMTGCSCVSLEGSADLSFNDANNVLAAEHITVGETRIQATLSETSALGRCLVAITLLASSSIELSWVDCVEGNTLSPPPYLDFGLDLMLCQRFYRKSYPYGINPKTPSGDVQFNGRGAITKIVANDTLNFVPGASFNDMANTPEIQIYSAFNGTIAKISAYNNGTDTIQSVGFANQAAQTGWGTLVMTGDMAANTLYAYHYVADCRP